MTNDFKTQNTLQDSTQSSIQGTIERIIFHNQDNDYSIVKLNSEDSKDPISAVGYINAPQVAMNILLKGKWVTHNKFGKQFAFESMELVQPSDVEGINLYLGSGIIKGIGPVVASKIVKKFGKKTLDIIDNDPEALLIIPGVGQKIVSAIKDCWSAQSDIRKLMLFLQPHGISPAYANRIYKYYGQNALDVVQENPYRMAMDIRGIGFHTADILAHKLGFEDDNPLRAEAACLYCLVKQNDEGHIYLPEERLINITSSEYNIDPILVKIGIKKLKQDDRIVIEDLQDHIGIYLSRNYHFESKISYYIQRIMQSPKSVRMPDATKIVEEVIAKQTITLAKEQINAVHTAAKSKIMVLTGGPGTGKTTIINTIIQVYAEVNAKILLAAPTGRAAKRISETSGLEAKTIHRLLEYSPKDDGFSKNENNPLSCGLIIIDESSMLDTSLMYHLMKALPLGTTLIFVGDINQLPSVGAGNVLRDIIKSEQVPVVELVEVFRQASTSDIIISAHQINHGEVPFLPNYYKNKSDFYFFHESDPVKLSELIVNLVSKEIPARFNFKAKEDIQVLSPMIRGQVGVTNLNTMLQNALNPASINIQRGERIYRLDDKVMQIRNNYDKDVYNGDMGKIIYLSPKERTVTVRFDERNLSYEGDEIDEIVPAYAISIHKSQGGEYPVVVIPLVMQHFILLQRNLVYTAITRGKKLVILAGETKALNIAIKNNQIKKRHTYLAERLKSN